MLKTYKYIKHSESGKYYDEIKIKSAHKEISICWKKVCGLIMPIMSQSDSDIMSIHFLDIFKKINSPRVKTYLVDEFIMILESLGYENNDTKN